MLILIALSRLLIMVLFVTLLPNVSPKRRSHKTTNDKIWDDGYVESYENPSTSIMPLFSPCTFPIHPAAASQQIPNSEMQFSWQLDTELEFNNMCHTHQHRFGFICDLHNQLNPRQLYPISNSFDKNRDILQQNGTFGFGILIVRYLAQPVSSSFVTEKSPEFGCIFKLPCMQMTMEMVEKFVKSIKTFTKVYVAAIFKRWFPIENPYTTPRIMILIVLDGILMDTRKLTSVNIYTENRHFTPYITNIQLETTNYLLQGAPLGEVLADLIDQLGFALREYYKTGGRPRQHPIPRWALILTAVSCVVLILALAVEWLIVRKKLIRRRTHFGVVADSIRKTHMMF